VERQLPPAAHSRRALPLQAHGAPLQELAAVSAADAQADGLSIGVVVVGRQARALGDHHLWCGAVVTPQWWWEEGSGRKRI